MDILTHYHSLIAYKDTPEVKVFQATENSSQNEVVLKLVKQEGLMPVSNYDALLEHKNVVKCYKTIECAQYKNEEYHLSILEYLKGKTLDEIQFKSREQKLGCIIQIIKGLGYLHNNNIIHGDLKPGNIIVVEEQGELTPKILDYCTFFSEGTQKAVTPEYLAPEFETGFTEQTDIWALGCIIYQLFMGKLPFGARNKGTDLNTIIRNSKTKPLEIDFDKVPEPYRKTVIKALEKKPNKRFKTTNELLKSLNKKPAFISSGVSFFYYLRKSFKRELIVIK